ncbi:uncharacterized protein LOC130725572 [Lotus japonicus]|uniref:uncharacterized protein LOC130725572 n=1 Tax=Lotus japonicus TaxID=34305 RepID=UPI00258397B4|nr:uncharacterized protein LOC130725572 [Lotus japonicus]
MNGKYSCKSGYKLLQVLTYEDAPSSSRAVTLPPPLWKFFWRTDALSRCKELTWRAIKGVLPVRHSLRVRGVDLDDVCPFCSSEPETSDHVLVRCPAVQPLWFASPLAVRVDQFSSMLELVIAFLSTAEEEHITVFQTWVYALWEARNSQVLDSILVRMERLLQRVAGLCAPPQPGPAPVVRDQRRLASSWSRPRQGTSKVNLDASYREVKELPTAWWCGIIWVRSLQQQLRILHQLCLRCWRKLKACGGLW